VDADAQLALLTKAQLVFSNPGTFLSFPVLSPPSYAPEQLAFATGGTMTAQDLAELVDFSRVVNVMPSGPIAPTADGEMLWEVCRDVLATAQLASGTMSAAEQAQYDAALAHLYEPVGQGLGLRRDSAALKAYRACRDAWFVAQEAYAAAKLSAQTSTDPELTARWAVDEPRLRAEISDRESAWATTGQRAQVEAALQVEQAIGARSPSRQWTRWQSMFQDVIDTVTGIDGSQVAVSGMAPADVLDGGTWPSFRLDASEIAGLVAQAPTELRAVLGQGSGGADLESITFEFRSVGLTRSWLDRTALTQHFWRLGPDGGELSDGATPPSGRCPSYVTGLVLARNIVVKRRAQPPVRLNGARWRELVTLHQAQLDRMPAQVRDHRDGGDAPALRDHRTFTGMMTAAHAVAAGAIVRDHRGGAGGGGGVVVRDHRDPGRILTGQIFTSTPADPPVVIGQPLPVPVDPISPDITVLAYICRPLGRCPDPDPSLTWSTGSATGSTTAQPKPAPRTHLVVRGDTLAAIAKRYYGDARRWPAIAEANRVTDPKSLKVGQKLLIP